MVNIIYLTIYIANYLVNVGELLIFRLKKRQSSRIIQLLKSIYTLTTFRILMDPRTYLSNNNSWTPTMTRWFTSKSRRKTQVGPRCFWSEPNRFRACDKSPRTLEILAWRWAEIRPWVRVWVFSFSGALLNWEKTLGTRFDNFSSHFDVTKKQRD